MGHIFKTDSLEESMARSEGYAVQDHHDATILIRSSVVFLEALRQWREIELQTISGRLGLENDPICIYQCCIPSLNGIAMLNRVSMSRK
jgi:hypothetical protein